MSTDRELLEQAAKAAGLCIDKSWAPPRGYARGFDMLGNAVLDWHNGTKWNPLADDGDALRLAVKLRLMVDVCGAHTEVVWCDEDLSESHSLEEWDSFGDDGMRTRRAIVRAAAEIGMAKT